MAEEKDINIKILIDAANAAKTVGETRKALKDLLVAAQEVEQGSAAFNQINSAAGELKDRIGDLQANVKFFADDLRGLTAANEIAQGIAASFGLVTASFEALGLSTASAEEATKKLVTVQTILNSLQTIGALVQKESAANILLTNAARAVGINLVVAEATATEGLTLAQKALNLVMKVSPMGILVGVATALIGAYTLLSGKTKELTEEQKQLNSQITKLRAEGELEIKTFNSQIEALKRLKTGSEERAILIDKINQKYGTTLKNLSDERLFLKQVNEAQDDYVKGTKTRILVKINEAKVESLLIQRQQELEKSRYAAFKANQILLKNATLAKQLAGKTELEILNSTFVSEEGIEYRRLLLVKKTAEDIVRANDTKINNLLNQNANYLSEETAQEKAAREKREADEKKAAADELARLKDKNKKLGTEEDRRRKELIEKNNKLINELIKKEKEANDKLKGINLNASELKPKVIQDLEKLKEKLNETSNTAKNLFPNFKQYLEAAGNVDKPLSLIDKFGVEFQNLRKELNTKILTPDSKEFLKFLDESRVKFKDFDGEQQAFVNNVLNNYLKVFNLLKDNKDAFKNVKLSGNLGFTGELNKEFATFEDAYDKFVSLIKDKLKFEGVQFFDIDKKTITDTFTLIDDTTKTTEEKVAKLNQVIIDGKSKLLEKQKELNQEAETLAQEQTLGKDTFYTEGQVKRLTEEIKAIEEGIKQLQVAVKTTDFTFIKDLYTETTSSQRVLDNLELFKKQYVKARVDIKKAEEELLLNKGLPNNEKIALSAERIKELNAVEEERFDILVQNIEETAKAENQVRTYSAEIKNLTKDIGELVKDPKKVVEGIKIDFKGIDKKDFDFKPLAENVEKYTGEALGKWGNFSNNVKKFFGTLSKEQIQANNEALLGNKEFVDENQKYINEILIKAGYSASDLAKLSGEQWLSIQKEFLNKFSEDQDKIIEEQGAKNLEVISRYVSEFSNLISNLDKMFVDKRLADIEKARKASLDAIEEEKRAYEFAQQSMTNAEQQKYDEKEQLRQKEIDANAVFDEQVKELEYQAATRRWYLSIAEGAVNAAQFILKSGAEGALIGAGAASILSAIQLAAIFANKPQKLATGGLVQGPGTATSDSIPTMLSNGEFVVNAKATSQNLPLLQQINGMNTPSPMLKQPLKMAAGGMVTQTNIDTSRLEELMMQMLDRPIKTYVVSSDMTNSQNKDNRIKQRTTF